MMADLDFDSPLDIPPLDDFAFPADLDSVQPFDLAFVFDGVDDEPRFGRGKDMEKLRRCHQEEEKEEQTSDDDDEPSKSDGQADEHHCPKESKTPSPPPSSSQPIENSRRQNWDDETKMEASKRKLRQRYEVEQRKKHKIQVIDIKNLPTPKPQRGGRVVNKSTKTFRSRKCLAF